MANTRINQIAKEAKVSNKEVIAKLAELGIEIEDENTEIDEDDAQLVLDLLREENGDYYFDSISNEDEWAKVREAIIEQAIN